MEDVLGRGFRFLGAGPEGIVHRVPPRGIEDFREVAETKFAGRLVEAREVEQDIGFHGREEREAGDPRCFIQELRPCDFPVVALRRRLADNQLHEVHLADHVLEGADVGVGDFSSSRDVAEGVEVLQEVV